MNYILLVGDPIGGFDFIGPFESEDLAEVYYRQRLHLTLSNWYIVPLLKPAPVYETQRMWEGTQYAHSESQTQVQGDS